MLKWHHAPSDVSRGDRLEESVERRSETGERQGESV